MAARSPVRYLAPIALVATLVAVTFMLTTFDGGGSGGTAGAGETTATAPRTPARRTYVVRQGDTLSSIAERFGLTQERLVALNPRLDAQALQPGMRIRLRR